MLNRFFKYLIVFSLVILPEISFAETKIGQTVATDFLQKVYNLMNNRNEDLVKRFFNYYALPEARFIKTEIEVDNVTGAEISNTGVNLSRDEYIAYISSRIKSPSKYLYNFSAVELKPTKNSDAIASFHVDETWVVSVRDQDLNKDITTKYSSSANCNMSVTLSSGDLQISGLNCLAKVTSKKLDINE
jgi:hypothetical protein